MEMDKFKIDNLKFVIILLINTLVSYWFNISSNFLIMVVVESIIWLLLSAFYYFIIGKKQNCMVNYSFYYLINLLLINMLFVIFEFDFILIKVINLLIIGFISFIRLDLYKIKKINIYLVLFNVVFFFLLSSSMVPIGQRNSTMDYSVFRYIGMMISKGKIPYKDVFDHKGLLLYFINYIGYLINEDIGIWLVELIFLYLSIILIYKIVNLFSNKLVLFSTIVIFLSLSIPYGGAGNSVEQYGIFFILCGMYLFYKDINKYKVVRLKNSFLIGSSLGAILMLRPNMVACYICMAIYLLIIYIRDNKIRELFKLICSFLLGIFILVLPFIIYLFINGAIDDFIYQYLIFNFSYSGEGTSDSLLSVIKFFLLASKLTFISFILIIFLLIKKKYDKSNLLLFLGMIILSFLLVVSPMNEYAHYAIVMIPTYIYPVAVINNYLYEIFNRIQGNKLISRIILVLITFLIFVADYLGLISNINRMLVQENEFGLIEEIINRETTSKDNILIFGNRVNIYLKTNRFSSSKYFYQIPVISIDNKLKEDFKNDINNSLPKLIIVYDDNIDDFYFKDNDVSKELFLDCFDRVIDNYEYYYENDNYYVYKLKTI